MSQIQSLEISRASSYSANAGQLIGKVRIEGENGTQDVRLSVTSMAAIFDLIRDQVSATAKANAFAVADALADGATEVILLENTKIIEGN